MGLCFALMNLQMQGIPRFPGVLAVAATKAFCPYKTNKGSNIFLNGKIMFVYFPRCSAGMVSLSQFQGTKGGNNVFYE